MADLARFSSLVDEYLQKIDSYQRDLAREISLSPEEFNRRFRGSGKTKLKEQDVKLIVLALAKWGGIGTQQQAKELLHLMDVSDFSKAQWATNPLKNLEDHPYQTKKTISTLYQEETSTILLIVIIIGKQLCSSLPPASDKFEGDADELFDLKELLRGRQALVVTFGSDLYNIGKGTISKASILGE